MLPVSPHGGGGELALHLKNICYKVPLCAYCQRQVVRHLLAYLSVEKSFVGDVPLKVNFLVIVNHPLAQEECQPCRWAVKYHTCLIRIATITVRYKIYNNAS